MTSIVTLPYEYFFDPDSSKPISSGFVYVGVPDLDPEIPANQLPVTLRQEDGTEVIIDQSITPIRTGVGGGPEYNGSPVQVLVDGAYSIKVLDSLGAQKFYSASVTDGVPLTEGTGVSAVPLLADLIAQDTTVIKQASVAGRTVAGDGFEGDFNFIQGNQSVNVTADPLQGIWVAPASDPTGASGAWKRDYDTLQLKHFGATGGVDDTSEIQSALNFGELVEGEAGKTYTISSTLSPVNGSRLDLKGSTFLRLSGSVFDMVYALNIDGFEFFNFVVDGQRTADGLDPVNVADRFAGVRVVSCTNTHVHHGAINNTSSGEIQVEGNRTACVFESCGSDCSAYSLTFTGNYSGFLFALCDGMSIWDMEGDTNLGSSVTSWKSPRCIYNNIRSYNSGYSGISINGKYSIASNLYATGAASGYGGINIGHDAVDNTADGSVITNAISELNDGWGITIVGSEEVALDNFVSDSNTNRSVYIFSNSSGSTLTNGVISNGASTGILIQSGGRHDFDNLVVRSNGLAGIHCDTGTNSVNLGPGVRCLNNGQVTSANSAGVLAGAGDITVTGGEYSDDQGTPTQEAGIWLNGVTAKISNPQILGNITYTIRETGSPVKIYDDKVKIGTDPMQGSFTAIASTSQAIPNNNSRNISKVHIFPLNAAAVTLGQPFLSSVVVGTSFSVTYPGTALATELYGYIIL